MADRNPNIPSERAADLKDNTQIDQKEARQAYGQQQATLQNKDPLNQTHDDEEELEEVVDEEETSSQ